MDAHGIVSLCVSFRALNLRGARKRTFAIDAIGQERSMGQRPVLS